MSLKTQVIIYIRCRLMIPLSGKTDTQIQIKDDYKNI
jgi:hypothetical protein